MRFASGLLLLLAVPCGARADLFTITGNNTTITFSLPASPVPDVFDPPTIYTPNGAAFVVDNVPFVDNGVPYTADVLFGVGTPYPSLAIYQNIVPFAFTFPEYAYLTGPQLYSGTDSTPTFLLSNYTLTGYAGNPTNLGFNAPLGTYNVSITPSVAATPEPSSLWLLGTGFAAALAVARKRFH